VCVDCSAGSACIDGETSLCPAGTFSLAGASTCSPCAGGVYGCIAAGSTNDGSVRNALVELYLATAGPSWSPAVTGWPQYAVSGDPCTSAWTGVGCVGGTVVYVAM
jgi:hypothetical protein